jgi:hypothetical protein
MIMRAAFAWQGWACGPGQVPARGANVPGTALIPLVSGIGKTPGTPSEDGRFGAELVDQGGLQKARQMMSQLLDKRFSVPDDIHKRVEGCTDIAKIDAWFASGSV